MDRFFEAVFLGLSSGAIYALVALGLVVVFRGTGHLNFAAGEMATLSAYIAWVVTTWTLFGDWQVPLWVATIAGMAVRVRARRRPRCSSSARWRRSRRSPCSSA